jgi:hypothetical protein
MKRRLLTLYRGQGLPANAQVDVMRSLLQSTCANWSWPGGRLTADNIIERRHGGPDILACGALE